MVDNAVEGWRVQLRESRMGELAVQAFLKAVHHGLPVELAVVRQAASVRDLVELKRVQQLFQPREEFLECRRFGRDGGEDQPGKRLITPHFFALDLQHL